MDFATKPHNLFARNISKVEGAIAMYKKNGFKIIPNYGQYINIESSICMQKILKKVFHDELGTIIIS